jgi:predicted kinase
MTANKPVLIIVTGRPAAGKSTIAQWLAGELKLPWVSKDSVREVLFEQLGWQDRPWAQKLGLASLELMFYFAQAQFQVGGSLILDNAYDPTPSTPRFQALQQQYNLNIIQVICNSDKQTLFERFVTRSQSGQRHPGHGDETVLDNLRTHLAEERPPQMELEGLVVNVDTTEFSKIDYPAILKQVKSLMGEL